VRCAGGACARDGREGGVQRLARRLGLRAFRPGSGERTFPSFLPLGRIDWVLVSRELRILGHRTFNDPVTDHCGVVAELGWALGAPGR
jgi:endonuclease/exonuclease/phosphatase family metal-dependent hydrolase